MNSTRAETYSFAAFWLPSQDFEGLHDDAASDDGVGGGDGWDNVASHRLDVEPRLLRDAENLRTDVGAGGHEVHGLLVVLVPHQVVFEIRGLSEKLEITQQTGT